MNTPKKPFRESRRQKFADEAAYAASDRFDKERWFPDLRKWSTDQALPLEMRASYARQLADTLLSNAVRAYTAGESIASMRDNLGAVVSAYVDAARIDREWEQQPLAPLFDFAYLDDYQIVLSLVSLPILLHREELLPDVHSLFKGGAPDGQDALVEELLGKFLPDRPFLGTGYHDDLCVPLLNATAEAPADEKQADVESYLKAWYKGMRGTGWYDSHKKQSSEGDAGYVGYWAFEAAAIAYLHDIDDAPFRDHLVYPKDLAGFARSMPRQTVGEATAGQAATRCEGGQPCPRAGWWHTPAREGSRQRFEAGTIMPKYASDYGTTIWQWDSNQAD